MCTKRNIDTKNKYILVIGAASGIGKATVKQLLKSGSKIIFEYDIINKALIENFQDHSNVVSIKVDISNIEQIKEVSKLASEKLDTNERLFQII